MDWKTLRREKLEKTEAYEPNRRLDSRWGRALDAVIDWWARFRASPVWEKLIVAAVAVLLVVLTPIALVSLFSGNDGQTQAGAPPPTPTLFILADQPTSTPAITATATPVKATPTPTLTLENTPAATQLPDRRDCAAIASTAYRSASERDWYVQNCVDSGPPPPPPPPPPGPAATATPSTYYSPAQAAALATQWIENDPSLGGLSLANGGCAAGITSPGQWRATCQGETVGCVGSACVITLRVCFADDPQHSFWLC